MVEIESAPSDWELQIPACVGLCNPDCARAARSGNVTLTSHPGIDPNTRLVMAAYSFLVITADCILLFY